MTTSLSNFKSETQLGTSPGSLITTTGTERKFLGNVTVTNTSTSNIEVTFWRLNSSTTEVDGVGGNWIVKETIPSGRTVALTQLLTHVLGPSMKISGQAGTTAVVNFDASGTTET